MDTAQSQGFDVPGRIKCGSVLVGDFDASLADYTGPLGLALVAAGVVDAPLATLWGAPAQAGKRFALLHGGGRPGYLRLIEGVAAPGHAPMATYGWAAFELSVADVHALHARLAGSAFAVIGAPRSVGDFTGFIPFQVAGRAGEVLYLNQVLAEAAGMLDLPFATAPVDHIFIAVLGASDRAAALAFHRTLGFGEAESYAFPIGVLNAAHALPAEHVSALTMTCVGRLPAVEIDQFPATARVRAVAPGYLPAGNAMVSFIVPDLSALRLHWLAPAAPMPGPLYAGRRVACVRGTAGELIELIEDAREGGEAL